VIDQLLVLGASGDLAGRYLLPALAHLQEAGRLPEQLAIVGVACDDWDTAAFRGHLAGRHECHAATVAPGAREALVAMAILAAWAEGAVPLQEYPAGSPGPRILPDHGGERSR
jgi:Glucose-6-phosphate dehydrogenase, NAD binding domain